MKKKLTKFYPLICSRHPTHDILRINERTLPLMPFRSIVRLGSLTVRDDYPRIEVNSVEAIKNSSNKLLMKKCFREADVKTAIWASQNEEIEFEYPIVAKHIFGSRGNGNTLIKTEEEFGKWIVDKNLDKYIFEKFYNYNREYRLHVTEDGCFYTCRKMLIKDTPEDQRWYRNDRNSNWIVEENPDFDKPVNWDNVVQESVKALKAVGLDVGAVDLRIQSRIDNKGAVRPDPDFIIVEINSAPSFGKITGKKYIEEIPKILTRKFNLK